MDGYDLVNPQGKRKRVVLCKRCLVKLIKQGWTVIHVTFKHTWDTCAECQCP